MNKRWIYLIMAVVALLNAVLVPIIEIDLIFDKKSYAFHDIVSECSKEAKDTKQGFFEYLFKNDKIFTEFELFIPFVIVILCFILLIFSLTGNKPLFTALSIVSLIAFVCSLPINYLLYTSHYAKIYKVSVSTFREKYPMSNYIFGKGEEKGALSFMGAGFWIALALFVIIIVVTCIIPDDDKRMIRNVPRAGVDPYAPQSPYFMPQNDPYAQNMQNGYAPQQPYAPTQNDPYAQNPQNGYNAQQNGYAAPQQPYAPTQNDPYEQNPQNGYNAQQNGYAASQFGYNAQQSNYAAQQNGYTASQSYYTAPQSENASQQDDASDLQNVSAPAPADSAADTPVRKKPMKFCPKCNEFTNSRTFCQKCGTQLIEKENSDQ